MSWQDDIMIEQEKADALNHMGEAEWKDLNEAAKWYCGHEVTSESEEE